MWHNFYKKYHIEVNRFIDQALEEDIKKGDHTSLACFNKKLVSHAALNVKSECIIAGIELAKKIFKKFDPKIVLSSKHKDGNRLKKGSIAFNVSGSAISLLTTERLVLNCIQRMSSIATFTNSLTEKINHTNCKILDTRKTTPGFRYPEKWAVTIGGGYNHRMGLFDAIMIKDNHVDFAGGMGKILKKTREYLEKNNLKIPVIVEVRNQFEIDTVRNFPWVKRILFDNIEPEELIRKVEFVSDDF